MLLLSRKRDERILLVRGDETIEIVICKIQTEHVQVGLEAPSDWTILRKELGPFDAAKTPEAVASASMEVATNES